MRALSTPGKRGNTIKPSSSQNKETVEKFLRLPRSIPPDTFQEKLTSDHIIPNLHSILRDLLGLRLTIDHAANDFFFDNYGFRIKDQNTLQSDSYKRFYNEELQCQVILRLKHLRKEYLKDIRSGGV